MSAIEDMWKIISRELKDIRDLISGEGFDNNDSESDSEIEAELKAKEEEIIILQKELERVMQELENCRRAQRNRSYL